MPSKPAKYGMKIWVVADCVTAYCGYMQAYLGKVGSTVEKGQGARVVKDLCQDLYGSGRNITMDNFFTQYTLAQELLQNKLTIVGTLRKNNAVIPPAMLADRKREVHSTMFGFSGQTTIASYVPKKNEAVIMLSTMHHDRKVEPQMDNKPDIILDYNKTKGAVDTLDKLCCQYSTKRGTRRWPLSMFFTLLDICLHNCSVIWFDKYPDWNKYPTSRRSDVRRMFILELGKQLCMPWIEQRAARHLIGLQPSVKRAMEYVNGPGSPERKKQKKICHDYHKPHLLKAAVTNVQGRKTIRHTFAAAHVRSLFVDIMRQRSMHVLMVARNMTTLTLSIYNFGRLLHDNVLLMNFPSHFCRLLSFIGYE